jgi:hypothetical protein
VNENEGRKEGVVFGTLSGERAIQFRAVLPPVHRALPAHRTPASALTVAGFILRTLRPLQAELDAALAQDDHATAAQLVYRTLLPIAKALSAFMGLPWRRGQARVHALMVELEPLPLIVGADGTLIEQGAAVTVHYRNWLLPRADAARWAESLSRELQSRWPDTPFIAG